MKTLHLHIGNYKTGSTAIQHFLGENREQFLKQGYYIPVTGFDGTAHHEWVWSLRGDTLARPKEELYASLRDEINNCGYDNILASTEIFFNGKSAEAFKEEIGEDVKIRPICFLRRQDEFLSAFYQQMIKHWRYRQTRPAVAADIVKGPSVQYLESLKRWKGVTAAENIVVLPYEKRQMPEGLLYSFLWALERDPKTFTIAEKPKQINVTIYRELIEFLRIANNVDMTREEHEALLELLTNISARSSNANFTKQSAFSPCDRQWILDYFKDQNKTIAIDYLGREDGTLFYDPLPDLDEKWNAPDLSVEQLSKIFVGLWLDTKLKIDGVSRLMDSDMSGNVIRHLLTEHHSSQNKA